ncbi:PP2C family serine/threonine-protein phosphatase, partial [Patescibacteria group bacterium]
SEGLMPTRSIGDAYFRPVGIISTPEVFQRKIRKSTIGFILATDGLWEVMDNEAVGEILKENKTARVSAEFIKLMYASIEPRIMLDNMTVMVIMV